MGSGCCGDEYDALPRVRFVRPLKSDNQISETEVELTFWAKIASEDTFGQKDVLQFITDPAGPEFFAPLTHHLGSYDGIVIMKIELLEITNPYPCELSFSITNFNPAMDAVCATLVLPGSSRHTYNPTRLLYELPLEDDAAVTFGGLSVTAFRNKRMPAKEQGYDFLHADGYLHAFLVNNQVHLENTLQTEITPVLYGEPAETNSDGITSALTVSPRRHGKGSDNVDTAALVRVPTDAADAALALLERVVLRYLGELHPSNVTVVDLHDICDDRLLREHLTTAAENPSQLLGSCRLRVKYLIVARRTPEDDTNINLLI